MILTEKHQIDWFRLYTLRQGLKLEMKGMTKKGRSCCAILKEMGFQGRTRKQVLESLEKHLEELSAQEQKGVCS